MSSRPAKRAPQSDWTLGDTAVVVAILLAFAAPGLLGFSRGGERNPLLQIGPASVTAAIAMAASVAIFRLMEPHRAGLRLTRDGTLGRRLYFFVAYLWILCPTLSIVRLFEEPSALIVVAVLGQLAAIAAMFHHARRSAA
ncbi:MULTISPECIES: hypothetical protein [unclassified Kribbella]|uniref:hypothetical protein n=1 Tax=unclassified Kribbella TaxID=2644121 RepID=UPI0030159665